ncbi:uncharacterized protein LOC142352205 isoform X2 [Convolutriloba macropyga]|uniref:uncharacterized protein LOC142352205 isoform X2 n=1 Tax=Convolutriloba macropyga TaxID=536237 RepID=UPI003F52401A
MGVGVSRHDEIGYRISTTGAFPMLSDDPQNSFNNSGNFICGIRFCRQFFSRQFISQFTVFDEFPKYSKKPAALANNPLSTCQYRNKLTNITTPSISINRLEPLEWTTGLNINRSFDQ